MRQLPSTNVCRLWFFSQVLFHLLLFCCLSLLFAGKSNLEVEALGGNETDKLALLEIKAKIVRDPLQVMSSWNDSVHFCQWHGVTCSKLHQRVIRLDLQSLQLVGSISPHIGNMSFLREVSLQNNDFSNTIPREIGMLFRLQSLRLDINSLGGEIPANISNCVDLVELVLDSNQLEGKLPQELGSLRKLDIFSANSNNLVGEIPSSLGNISSLKVLNLIKNSLQGSIPESLGQLKSLVELQVSANKLSGIIPSSIYNVSSIASITVADNQLRGTLPSSLGLSLPNLLYFYFHTNQFSGVIPVTISNASNLMEFVISKNQFTGKVPSLASLQSLQDLQIDENILGNEEEDDLDFLSSLVNCTNLVILDIGKNNFGGALPDSIGNFSKKIRKIGLGLNQILGSIPSGITNLADLEELEMKTNHLTGSIPRGIGRLQQLRKLDISGNNVSGNIPSSLGNLTQLLHISLRYNNLQGSIPESLGNCQFLILLELDHNNFNGIIPKQLISLSSLSIKLDLSNNYLTGSLPVEVGDLVNLGYLDVSENNISGEIPTSLSSCTRLENLYMQGNHIQGSIPLSLKTLRGIRELDLSHNNLSGKIPSYFEDFPLQKLNLSFNDFEGVLPNQGIFKNASAVSVLGNKNLCGGVPELHLPVCAVKRSNKRRLSSQMIVLISCLSGLTAITLVFSFIVYWFQSKRKFLPIKSSSEGSLLTLSYDMLHKATDGFSSSNLIGIGSFGSVYKGSILNQAEKYVAVKVLNLQRTGAMKSFMAECEALRCIRHRNLVKILTACSSIDFQGNDFRALIYQYMANGSLEEWLHPTPSSVGNHHVTGNLSIQQSLNIAIDVAHALDYLHHGCQTLIIHCDLKPSNVLLDSDMTAHVGDFGLARILSDTTYPSSDQTSSLGIKGSIGYAAPEYGMGAELSTYGDVYSYGILLLELFTGKRPTDSQFIDGLNLNNFAKMALPERVLDIVDSKLLQIELKATSTEIIVNDSELENHRVQECLNAILEIGVACSADSPRERMDISDVVPKLRQIRNVLHGT